MLKVASSVVLGALSYQGTWNASSNTPFLQSSVGVQNQYYVVSVAGNTNLNGITTWNIGDWALFNGTVWEKLNGSTTSSFSNLTVTSLTGYMYANGANVVTASTTIPVANVSGAVPNTVYVIAGTNLTGGGALTGNVTLNNPYSGTVTNIATGTGLSGGPITGTGTISISNTGVTAATYGSANTAVQLQINAQGQVTSAANAVIAIAVSQVSGAVPNTVNVLAGTGLSGGGALTGNVTLTNTGVLSFNTRTGNVTLSSLDVTTALGYTPGTGNGSVTSVASGTGLTGGPITTTGTLSIANTTVVSGSYGNASTVPSLTVNAQGQLTAAANTTIAIGVGQVSGAVPNTVQVIAGTGLTGGGALTGSVTLNIAANSVNQKVGVYNNGVFVASEPGINFAPGNNITLTITDDPTNTRANVVIATSGLGTMANQNANAVVITGGTINGVALTIDTIQNTPVGTVTPAAAGFTTANISNYAIFSGQSSNPSVVTGSLWYDTAEDALSYWNASGYEVNIGQQVVTQVQNNSGSTIPVNSVVYISGSAGTIPKIDLAIANSEYPSYSLGITVASIAAGAVGYVINQGTLDGQNTSGFSAGDIVYLSPTTAGAYTNVKPSSPNYTTKIGNVIKANSTTGVIYVSLQYESIDSGNIIGTVAVPQGGTGATTLTGYVYGNGTSAMTASTTIPNTSITGLGTMSTQNANNVAITGGTINVQTTNHVATTTANATFATSSLPLVPAGYFEMDLNGTVVKVPYYAV